METVVSAKKNPTNGSSSEKQKGVKNHELAAHHHQEAAKYHLEAAKHHEAGNDKKASECTVKALGHHCLANEAQREDVKHHAT